MKLTPIELAIAPVCVAAEEHHYNFSTQRRAGVTASSAYRMGTTQTFNTVGKPTDTDR